MPGQPIQVGPFIGGLNTFSDATAIADNELVTCQNFDLDLDGSLVSRPPFADYAINFPLGVTGNMLLLGYYYAANGTPYLLASDGLTSTYFFNGTTWTLITNKLAAAAMVQFNGQAWMTAPLGSSQNGGYWMPSGMVGAVDGYVQDANMPKGEVLVAHKFRLWVAAGKNATSNGTRLYRSEVLGIVPFWKVSPDFIDVGAGDGQNIVSMAVNYNTLLIFRTRSVFAFNFTTDPGQGSQSLVVPGVGLSDKAALVQFESFIYWMYDDRAYEFSNSRATQINQKVPFRSGNETGIYLPFAVSEFNRRIIFSYYDVMYVFGLKTRTWTTWKSIYGGIGKVIKRETGDDAVQAIAHSSVGVTLGGTRVAKTLQITDALTTDTESMECIVQTKNFNYEASSVYKRLFWWGIDATFRGLVKGYANPITYNYAVTWGTLRTKGVTWGQLRQGGYTWSQPQTDTLVIETERTTAGTSTSRKFIKFLKSLRFRQINYRLVFATDGSRNTAPVRLFSLMTYVKAKERVSKTVT